MIRFCPKTLIFLFLGGWLTSKINKLSWQQFYPGKSSTFNILRRLVFEQVKGLLILEFHEMIKVPHVVVCPIVFLLLCGRSWQKGVFKVIKK